MIIGGTYTFQSREIEDSKDLDELFLLSEQVQRRGGSFSIGTGLGVIDKESVTDNFSMIFDSWKRSGKPAFIRVKSLEGEVLFEKGSICEDFQNLIETPVVFQQDYDRIPSLLIVGGC